MHIDFSNQVSHHKFKVVVCADFASPLKTVPSSPSWRWSRWRRMSSEPAQRKLLQAGETEQIRSLRRCSSCWKNWEAQHRKDESNDGRGLSFWNALSVKLLGIVQRRSRTTIWAPEPSLRGLAREEYCLSGLRTQALPPLDSTVFRERYSV